MPKFKKNTYNKKRNNDGSNPFRRSDALPFKKINHEQVDKAVEAYLANGGKITKITEEDILKRRREDIDLYGFYEAYNFLNGD